jgi:cell division transport system permease protein
LAIFEAMSTSPSRPRKTLGSYPSVSVIFSITLALFVIGLFGLLVVYSNELERVVRESFKVQVFLKNELTDSVKTVLKSKIEKTAGVAPGTLVHISKEDARKKFTQETGEDFSFLGENLLRESYQFGVSAEHQDSTKLLSMGKTLEKLNGVFQVHYQVSSITGINKNRTQIGLVLVGVAVILFVVVVLLINNTLRLALFSQRFLIRSMQLVGATRSFIQKPFLAKSILYGLIGGIVSSGLLVGVVMYANRRIPELAAIQNNDRILIVLGGLVALGIFVALLSTYRAVSKYLQLSLDELY